MVVHAARMLSMPKYSRPTAQRSKELQLKRCHEPSVHWARRQMTRGENRCFLQRVACVCRSTAEIPSRSCALGDLKSLRAPWIVV